MAFERKHFNMDPEWRFHLGDVGQVAGKSHSAVYNSVKAGSATGPATKGAFDDSDWTLVDLPHDYIREAPFSPDAVGNHGYREKSDGWYRKTFTLDPALAGKHAMLVFDGISTSSVIYLNGSILARSFSLYSQIALDVTDRLYYDRINTLAVFTRGEDTEGWWYEGAGIYRHVHLYIKDPVHIAHNGLFAKPLLQDAATNRWVVELETTLENSSYLPKIVTLRATVLRGDTVCATAESGEILCPDDSTVTADLTLPVLDPALWDVDDPNLYTVQAEVLCNGEILDSDRVRIGFRTFSIDAENGFFLNGRPLKLYGTCNHQDHAGVGVAVPDSIQYYRIRRLKEMGCNAYRCAHNPPAPELLDACDEYGMLVMDENRRFESGPAYIQYLETMIRRDRNHPSVIFYSLFNEEPLQNSAEGLAIFRRLKSRAKRLDSTRLYVGAINDTIHPGGAGEAMDVLSVNYNIKRADSIHARWPHMPILGSENGSAFSTRGCYQSNAEGAHVMNNYDEEKAPWGDTVRDNWSFVTSHRYFAGAFSWTGFDYRGEPTPFTWPSAASQFGIMDLCGFPKDSYYFHQAFFRTEPMLHILPHWNHESGKTVRVMTVTNCEEVELFLNGRSLGRRPSTPATQLTFDVPFEPGTLSAVALRGGKVVATAEQKTAAAPVAIRLTPDRTLLHNAGGDTVPVRVSVVDANGVEVPTADHLIRFTVEGDGCVAGVGNGNPNSHEPEHLPYRHLFCGLCQVLVAAARGAEKLKLTASCEGLTSAEVVFEIQARPQPAYLFSKPNTAVTGILASVTDSEEKPDPAHVYSEDDMNSFAPMILEKNRFGNHLPGGFKKGWRAFRLPITLPKHLPKGKVPALEIASIVCDAAEFYVDGQRIFAATPDYKAPLTVPLILPPHLSGEQSFEVRALLKAGSNASCSSGFAFSISLSFTDET